MEKVVALLPRTPFLCNLFEKLSLGWTSYIHASGNKLEGGSITVISKPICIGKKGEQTCNPHMLIGKFSHERGMHPAFGTERVDKTWRLKVISLWSRIHSRGSVGLSASFSASNHIIITRSCGRAGVISLRNVPHIDLHRLKNWPFLLHDKLPHQMVILSYSPL